MDQSPLTKDDDFEQALFSNASFCYSVALGLTHNPRRARILARETLMWAWHLHENHWETPDLKTALLSELHERFLLRRRGKKAAFPGTSELQGLKM